MLWISRCCKRVVHAETLISRLARKRLSLQGPALDPAIMVRRSPTILIA